MALYNGWDLDEMRTAGDEAALQGDYIPSSTFTPINRPVPPRQLLTPESTVISSTARHGPIIARYLGLGDEPEASQLELIAPPTCRPVTPPTSQYESKRGRNKHEGSKVASEDVKKTKLTKQKRVSNGMRATKSVSRNSVRKSINASGETASVQDPPIEKPGKRATSKRKASSIKSVRHEPSPSGQLVAPTSIVGLDTVSNPGISDTMKHDEFGDEFTDIDLLDLDNTINTTTTNVQSQSSSKLSKYPTRTRTTRQTVELSDQYVEDDNLFLSMLGSTEISSSPTKESNASAPPKAQFKSSARICSRKFVSPITLKTQALGQMAVANESRKPIVRSPFPTPVRDRSPVIGLSPNLLLRTCFRTGEAINQASHASKHGQTVIFELYAKIQSSHRDETKQHFVFADLFHDKPPYIKGVYEAAVWKQVELYNYDSRRLLKQKTMCRCIGEIKRNGNSKEWIMTVHNIWETTWEDVEWVEGIINA